MPMFSRTRPSDVSSTRFAAVVAGASARAQQLLALVLVLLITSGGAG